MSDEFEDISVEAESPVAGAGTETPVAVESSAEPVGAEIEATQVNLAPADDSLKQNSQQAYLETVAPERVSSAAPITAAGHAAKEAEQEEKKAQAHEHFEQEQKHAAARREWMERDHDFGGQKMSGHDLTKLLDFISNPAMQDKLRDRLGKTGMPKDKIDKGMKELQEFIDLKKKEKEGDLSEDQKRRLSEIEKSEEFKATAQQTQEVRNDMELKTAGATTKTVGQKIEAAEIGVEAAAKQKDSLGSYASVVIQASPITDAYNNVASAANKNEPKDPEVIIAQANTITKKPVEVGASGFTV